MKIKVFVLSLVIFLFACKSYTTIVRDFSTTNIHHVLDSLQNQANRTLGDVAFEVFFSDTRSADTVFFRTLYYKRNTAGVVQYRRDELYHIRIIDNFVRN